MILRKMAPGDSYKRDLGKHTSYHSELEAANDGIGLEARHIRPLSDPIVTGADFKICEFECLEGI